MAAWNESLTRARRDLGLRVGDIAERAGVGEWTLRSYELGRRQPSRERLEAVLGALNLDQHARNAILVGAGFAADVSFAGRTSAERYLDVDAAAEEVAMRPWPSLVVDEMINVRAANDLFLKLWGIKRSRLDDPVARNVLAMCTERRIADRCLSWDEGVGGLIALFKAHVHHAESLDRPSSSFAAVLERVYAGDAKYVRRFVDLWDATPGQYPGRVTWNYPMVWRVPKLGTFQFRCVAFSVNEIDSLDIDEWMPADAETFALVERLRVG